MADNTEIKEEDIKREDVEEEAKDDIKEDVKDEAVDPEETKEAIDDDDVKKETNEAEDIKEEITDAVNMKYEGQDDIKEEEDFGHPPIEVVMDNADKDDDYEDSRQITPHFEQVFVEDDSTPYYIDDDEDMDDDDNVIVVEEGENVNEKIEEILDAVSNATGCSNAPEITKEDYEELDKDTPDVQTCNMCRRKVLKKDKHSISEHIVDVHGIKPWYKKGNRLSAMCLYCDYQSKFKQNVLHHMQLQHLKIKDKMNYRCLGCGWSCTYQSQIQKHVKSVHKKIKDWQCPLCTYSSTTREYLKNHIRKRHIRGQCDYMCELCRYSCNLKGLFKKHIEITHQETLMVCQQDKCSFACATIERYRHHMTNVHCKAARDDPVAYAHRQLKRNVSISVFKSYSRPPVIQLD